MGFRTERERASRPDRSASPEVDGRYEAAAAFDYDRYQDRRDGDAEPSTRRASMLSRDAASDLCGFDLYRDGQEVTVQRLVDSHGAGKVRRWADEGMTLDTMGKPRDMAQFRDRQRERPPEVPWNVERQNARSVQRSRDAHLDSSKAGDAGVPDSVRDVIGSPGRQLDDSIQQAIEARMGDNLGDVRIHTGPQAAKACEDINARAFTVGNHVAFNTGEYDPESPEGQHVLAHELAHVRQQTGGAVSMLPQSGELAIDPDERLEREAEQTAERVLRGGDIGVSGMRDADVHVQRMSADKSAAFYESVIDAIRRESELDHEDIDRIKNEVAEGMSGTDYSGSIGHDELNVKQLQKASEAAAHKADAMETVENTEAIFADDASSEMMAAAQEDLAAGANTHGQVAELTDGERSAMDVVHENAKMETEYPEALEEIYELEVELQSLLGDGDVRLTDAQEAELQSVKQDIAEKFGSQKAEIAITYLTNLLTNQTMGAGLSGLLAKQIGTAEASATSAAIIMSISMGLAALAQTMADYYTEPDDDTGDGDSQGVGSSGVVTKE